MRTTTRISVGAALLAALLAAVGCEDTALTPGEDFTMSLVARPSTVLIDATHTQAQASIVATVYSDTGVPQSGITVLFSSDGGTLASGNAGVKTDADGNAIDTLTITAASPDETSVTATSAALAQTVKVNKSTTTTRPPVAVIEATPVAEQKINLPVVFNGGNSTDPDVGGFIASHKWLVKSSFPAPNTTVPLSDDTAPSISFNGFTSPQTLAVTLTVTDNTGLKTPTSISYAIKACDNPPPTAVIAGPTTITLIGAAGSTKTAALDSAGSFDFPPGVIASYSWNCGNGVASSSAPTVSCAYVVASSTVTYTATLAVQDDGAHPADSDCPARSATDSLQIVVVPSAGP